MSWRRSPIELQAIAEPHGVCDCRGVLHGGVFRNPAQAAHLSPARDTGRASRVWDPRLQTVRSGEWN